MTGTRIALLVLAVFAALWAWAGLRLSGTGADLALVPVGISLALLAWGWGGSVSLGSSGQHVGRTVALWSAVEVAALLAVSNLLVHVHRGDLMLPLGALVVGLHFFPLARGIPVRLYNFTGAGLLLAGACALLVSGSERQMVAGMGSALVLWATSAAIGHQGRRATAGRLSA